MCEYAVRYIYYWSGLTKILHYEICYMQSDLSAESRAHSRNLVDVVISEPLDSTKKKKGGEFPDRLSSVWERLYLLEFILHRESEKYFAKSAGEFTPQYKKICFINLGFWSVVYESRPPDY